MQVSKEFRGELYQTIGHVNSLIGGAQNGYIRTELLQVQSLLNIINRSLEAEPPQPAQQQFKFCGTYINTGCEQPITCNCCCCEKHCTCVKPALNVEPPKGANSDSSEKVSKTLSEKLDELIADPKTWEPEKVSFNLPRGKFNPPKAYYDFPEDEPQPAPKLDFLGRWKTRGGYFVEVTKFTETEEWTGHYTDRQGLILYWNQEGKNTNSDLDLLERFREAQKFANG